MADVTGWLARLLSASLLALAVLNSGCVSGLSPGKAWPGKTSAFADGPGDPLLAAGSRAETTRNLPRSRTGNAPVYTVFGRDYRVLDSAAGYDEQGLASWYGAKFHGRKTSSGEVYDMHAMTAAHKHLPLPILHGSPISKTAAASSSKSMIVGRLLMIE